MVKDNRSLDHLWCHCYLLSITVTTDCYYWLKEPSHSEGDSSLAQWWQVWCLASRGLCVNPALSFSVLIYTMKIIIVSLSSSFWKDQMRTGINCSAEHMVGTCEELRDAGCRHQARSPDLGCVGGYQHRGTLFPASVHSDVEVVAIFMVNHVWFIAADQTWARNRISVGHEEQQQTAKLSGTWPWGLHWPAAGRVWCLESSRSDFRTWLRKTFIKVLCFCSWCHITGSTLRAAFWQTAFIQ